MQDVNDRQLIETMQDRINSQGASSGFKIQETTILEFDSTYVLGVLERRSSHEIRSSTAFVMAFNLATLES